MLNHLSFRGVSPGLVFEQGKPQRLAVLTLPGIQPDPESLLLYRDATGGQLPVSA
jgi:hypothetical protein